MSTPFLAGEDGTIGVGLEPEECLFLTGLVAQLVELVESDDSAHGGSTDPQADELAAMVGIGTSTHLPLDPVLARLFPDAYDDAVAAGDFRRYTELRLRGQKARNAATISACLARPAPIVLDPAEAAAWLGALNDLRLVLGTVLDVSEEDDVESRLDEEDGDTYNVYLWLTHLQGCLIDALDQPPA